MANPRPKSMTVAEANGLREAILSFPDLKASEVAQRVGCGISTVHKIRKNPRGDGRSRKATQRRANARMRMREEEAELWIEDVVEERRPSERLIRGLGLGPVFDDDPYADRQFDGYVLASNTDPESAAPEIALLRTQIRQTGNQIHEEGQTIDRILVLQAHLNDQIETLLKAIRTERGGQATSQRQEMVKEGTEVAWKVQGGGGGHGERAHKHTA